MANAERNKKRRKLRKACKLDVGFADAMLELNADLRLSPAERRKYLKMTGELYSRTGSKQRFLRYLEQLADDATDEGYSPFQIGDYLEKRLKDKRLPKLEKQTDPRWIACTLEWLSTTASSNQGLS